MGTQFRSDDTVKWWLGFGSGVDGALTISADTTDAPVDSSCSGTSGATSLSATNASFSSGQAILIHQTRGTGAGSWELNQIASYTAGTITTYSPLKNTYTDSGASQAQVLVMKQYSNATINSGFTLTAKAWDGNVGGIIGFFCNGTFTKVGGISTVGKGFRGGGAITGFTTGTSGESTTGAGSTTTNANGMGGGGGVGSDGSAPGGGGGGHATSGDTGQVSGGAASPPGTGGSTGGSSDLTTAIFGGAGGSGGGSNDGSISGTGGDSGGGVFIFASNMALSGSALSSTGEAGGNNSGGVGDAGGGGGGAGGFVLLKCLYASLGTSLVTCAGGAKGTATGVPGGDGGVGGTGFIHIDYKFSITGTTSPTASTRQDTSLGGAVHGRIF